MISMAGSTGTDAAATAIRQATSVYLKNFIDKHWETYDEPAESGLINDADRTAIRGTIVEAVVAAPEQVRVQLLTVVRRLVRSDFPKTWATPLDQIVPLLQSEDVNKINAGLLCFLEIVNGRCPVAEVVEVVQDRVFPILLEIGQRFVQHTEEPAAQQIVKTVMKCYFNAIQFRFSKWLMSGEVFMAWSSLAIRVIQAPVPAAVLALDEEDASEDRFWKMKKWAFHIHNKVMSRYGNPKLDSYNSDSHDFAKAYMASLALPVLEIYLGQIHAAATGSNPVPERIVSLVCDFLENCIPNKRTWEVLKEQVMWLVQEFVFPRLCWSEADAELWQDDPHEFIRSRLDPFDDLSSAATSCINLVVELVKQKKKATFLPVLGFLNSVLAGAQGRSDQASLSRRDGALYLVGSLATLLTGSKKTAGQMEAFMTSFVIPELTSPTAHIRLRACWTVEQFDELEYGSQEASAALLSGVLSCMNGTEFPVKVAASSALAAILGNEFVKAALPPYLPTVIETILTLANEIELDSLSYVLEDLVTEFAEEVSPYAAQLCAQLCDTLMRSIEHYDGNADEENAGLFEDTDKMMAVLGMLGTINTLVDSMSSKPETMAQIETIVLPLVYMIFQRKIMDVYEEAFTLLDSLMYGQKAVSPAMWQLLEPIHMVFKDCGSSYIPDMASTLDNYVSYGRDQLLANPAAVGMIADMIRITMTDTDFVESDWVHGCNLMEAFLLNCRGAIDQLVPLFIQLTMAKLADRTGDEGTQETGIYAVSHRVYHLEVILEALYYNPVLAVQELERTGLTAVFLAKWFEVHTRFTRVHDKKVTIVAVSALLQSGLTLEQLPAAWQQNWAGLMPVYLEAIKTLPKAVEERQKMKEADERSDSDDDTYQGRHRFVDDDDADHEEEASEDEARPGKSASFDDGFEQYDPEDDDDSDDDWEDTDELEEELYLETPLDHIDVAGIVTSSLRGCLTSQPAAFQHLTQSLDADQQATLQAILQH